MHVMKQGAAHRASADHHGLRVRGRHNDGNHGDVSFFVAQVLPTVVVSSVTFVLAHALIYMH